MSDSIHHFAQQVHQHAGVVGAAVTASTGLVGWLAPAISVLQIISLLISIAVGLLTARHYIRKWRKGE